MEQKKEEKPEAKAGDIKPLFQIVGFEVYDGKEWIQCEKPTEAKILSLLLEKK